MSFNQQVYIPSGSAVAKSLGRVRVCGTYDSLEGENQNEAAVHHPHEVADLERGGAGVLVQFGVVAGEYDNSVDTL